MFFSKRAIHYSGTVIAKRLIATGREYKCALCQLTTWNGESITLHVDHINGDNLDNHKKNIRFLCPNCHQQTTNWGSKNRKYCSTKTPCPNCGKLGKTKSTRKFCRNCASDYWAKNPRKVVGRPKIKLTHESLQNLINQLPQKLIADLLGVSQCGVSARCRALNVTTKPRGFWSEISDSDLRVRLDKVKNERPYSNVEKTR